MSQGLGLGVLKMLGLGFLTICHGVLKGLGSPRTRHEGPQGLGVEVPK